MNKEYSQGFLKNFEREYRTLKLRFTEQFDKTDDLKHQNEKLKLKNQILTEQISKLEKENKTLKAEKELAEGSLERKSEECDSIKDNLATSALKFWGSPRSFKLLEFNPYGVSVGHISRYEYFRYWSRSIS